MLRLALETLVSSGTKLWARRAGHMGGAHGMDRRCKACADCLGAGFARRVLTQTVRLVDDITAKIAVRLPLVLLFRNSGLP